MADLICPLNPNILTIDKVEKEFIRCRGCNHNMAGMSPATQYQRQKIIQNTVRVPASLYVMNLGALSGYRKPLSYAQLVVQDGGTPYLVPPYTYWNQMSDRPMPAKSLTHTASGATYHGSSTRHTITRMRPNAMNPGGVGVDIKHNSYDRYLNRLKAKKPLRRGIVPPTYGIPYIPFDPAFPVYGGKTVKTAIIEKCDCVKDSPRIFDNPAINPFANTEQRIMDNSSYTFMKGDYVWAKLPSLSNNNNNNNKLFKAVIITMLPSNLAEIRFIDEQMQHTYGDIQISLTELLLYTNQNKYRDNCIVDPLTLPLAEVILNDKYYNLNTSALLCKLIGAKQLLDV